MENKIEQLFLRQDQVSLQKDILPLVLEEFEQTNLDEAMYAMACDFVKQQLYAIHISGIQTVCYPVFRGEPQSGILSVVDVVWEKIRNRNRNRSRKVETWLTNLNK